MSGRPSMIVMSPARARLARIPVHPEAVAVAELRPDDGPPFFIGFATFAQVHVFIHDMPTALVWQPVALVCCRC